MAYALLCVGVELLSADRPWMGPAIFGLVALLALGAVLLRFRSLGRDAKGFATYLGGFALFTAIALAVI